ncbi:hypothetical protein [Streptosporangium vulgare]|uniref:hypothetical protein n=1 Tax=Streptosporangium vulgare TaxID=46190 RepID=UPI0031DD97BF
MLRRVRPRSSPSAASSAGSADNVIPEEARFEATIRSFSSAAHRSRPGAGVTLVKGIAAAHGCWRWTPTTR